MRRYLSVAKEADSQRREKYSMSSKYFGACVKKRLLFVGGSKTGKPKIDFTAIQLEATSKVLYLDVDEQAMKIEPLFQIQMKCADLNLDGDEGKNLID
ncbi:hypothetical protein LguiA_006153 [Lonicera macranthoides]